MAYYGLREDNTNKGSGYFGELQRPDGQISTELSVDVDGKLIPLLVPTLNNQEVNHLLGGNRPTPEIMQKAISHAQSRIGSSQNPFAQSGESIYQPVKQKPLGVTTKSLLDYFKE